MSAADQQRIRGHFNGMDSAADVSAGKEMVDYLGIKVQQLADCNICHR